MYLAWYTTNYVLFLCQQNWIRHSVWSQYPVSHHTATVPVRIITWGMCVPFKVRVQQLQCLRREWRPAFSLLGWLNTNKLSEVILPTLVSATGPLAVLSDAPNKVTIRPRECIRWVMDDKSTIYGALAQLCWIRIHGTRRRQTSDVHILIRSNEMQQYAGVYLLQKYSTCFGCLSHPSSGVRQTVTAEPQPFASVALGHAGERLWLCSYSLTYSWWWVWQTPETCRVILQ